MTSLIQTTGVSAVIASHLFIIGILASYAISHDWFRWESHALSDLGNYVNSYSSAILFNTTLIVTGALVVIFAMGLFRKIGKSNGLMGVLLLGITAAFLILVGVFSDPHELHWIVSIGYFIFSPSAALVLGISLWKEQLRGIAKTTSVAGIIIVMAHMSIFVMPSNIGPAIPEFIGAVSAAVWIAVVGRKLSVSSSLD